MERKETHSSHALRRGRTSPQPWPRDRCLEPGMVSLRFTKTSDPVLTGTSHEETSSVLKNFFGLDSHEETWQGSRCVSFKSHTSICVFVPWENLSSSEIDSLFNQQGKINNILNQMEAVSWLLARPSAKHVSHFLGV